MIWMLIKVSANSPLTVSLVGHAEDVIWDVLTAVTEVTLLWLCCAASASFSRAHYIILRCITALVSERKHFKFILNLCTVFTSNIKM